MTFPRFAIFLAIVLAVWFWPSIFGGKVLLPTDLTWQYPPQTPPAGVTGLHNPLIGDMLYENYAWKTLLRRCLADGEWPLWNPYAFCGHPLYATGQASTFYPLNIIFVLAPLLQAYVIYTVLHLWLAGVFQYLFLRRIGVSPFGCAIGGVVFAMCGFLAMQLIWPMLLGSAIWLPLMLLWILRLSDCFHAAGDCPHFAEMTGGQRLSEGPKPKEEPAKWGLSPFSSGWRIGAGAVIFAMPVLSGFFEIAFYAWFVAGLFTVACCGHVWRHSRSAKACLRLCASVGTMAVLAVMLTGPQLLPFLEVKDMTTRAGEASYERMVDRALRAEHLLEMVIPDVFGNPSKHETFDLRTRGMRPIEARRGADFYAYGTKNYNENGFYLGLLPLGLMVIGLFARGRYRWFLITLLVLSLLLAFGTRIYAVFYYTVPGFDQVRTPFRWMFPATFAICCLAAMGAQHWFAATGRGPRPEGRGEETGDAPAACAMPAALRGHADTVSPSGSRLSRIVGVILIAVPVALALALLFLIAFPSPAHHLAERALESVPRLSQGNGFLDAWDLAGFMWANAMRFSLFALAAAVVIALPLLKTWRPRATATAGLFCLILIAADPLQANGRFMTQADPGWLDRVPPAVEFLRSDSGTFRIARFGRRMVLHPNLPMIYGLQDTGGYDSIILAEYARYVDAIEPQRALWYNQIVGFEDPASLDSPLLSLLNIRYLLVDSSDEIDHSDWELVFSEGVQIYRNKRESARAFMVHQVESVTSFDEAIERLVSEHPGPARTVVENAPDSLTRPVAIPANSEGVKITRHAHTAVELTSSSSVSGLVVLCDMIYPGWRAYVDGRPADILRVNGIFRGVAVPAGQHSVAFRFEPASLRNGLILLCLGLLAVGGCVAVSCLPSRRKCERS
ncbi:MAG: YfhO family protein [Phycisphaerae bacterium]|nr:YfhO family protein [Phycisphaerae bacterium]